MPTTVLPQPIPLAQPVSSRFETAAALLEEARQLGCQEPAIHYLAGLAYKRQGKTQAARQALQLISQPDSNVWLRGPFPANASCVPGSPSPQPTTFGG